MSNGKRNFPHIEFKKMFTSADRMTGLNIVSVFEIYIADLRKQIFRCINGTVISSLVLVNSFTFLQDTQPPHHYLLHTSQNLILFRNIFFKYGAEAVIFIEYFCVHIEACKLLQYDVKPPIKFPNGNPFPLKISLSLSRFSFLYTHFCTILGLKGVHLGSKVPLWLSSRFKFKPHRSIEMWALPKKA